MTPGGLALPPKPRREPKKLDDLVLEADLPQFIPLMVDADEFKGAVGRAARDRVRGEPKPGTFIAVMDAIWIRVTITVGHVIRDPMWFIGEVAGYGRETVRKCIRKAERVGVIGSTPVMVRRDDGQLRRAANWYLPIPARPPGSSVKAKPDPKYKRDAKGWVSFVLRTIAKLHKRPGHGYNTSPMRPRPAPN
jgi:hypothetical protein